MHFLKVPFSEKDRAKGLGAKWNAERKSWYVPAGMPITPFEQWLPKSTEAESSDAKNAAPVKPKKAATSSDSVGVQWPTNTGSKFFKIDHDCIPWEPCEVCLKDPRIRDAW